MLYLTAGIDYHSTFNADRRCWWCAYDSEFWHMYTANGALAIVDEETYETLFQASPFSGTGGPLGEDNKCPVNATQEQIESLIPVFEVWSRAFELWEPTKEGE